LQTFEIVSQNIQFLSQLSAFVYFVSTLDIRSDFTEQFTKSKSRYILKLFCNFFQLIKHKLVSMAQTLS